MGTTEVRFIVAWQTYRVGDVIRPAATLRTWLLNSGYVELAQEAETPPRPAKLARAAAAKIADGSKKLFS